MIHHISVGTNDRPCARILRRRTACDRDALAQRLCGFCGLRHRRLLFSVETPVDGKPATPENGVHIALAHGGRDAGAPVLRPEYDGHDYGAFIFDPDGNKIEAVTYSSK
ncbi:VOC family protein [Bosea sp. Root483D1]|uniref:VOC family protein n=1 Tax=Bosea sp. Root483D1 TaxID=1736544 RepID=UPI001FCCEEE0|nr:VOC family protein [Bosea sp. Root483D1]